MLPTKSLKEIKADGNLTLNLLIYGDSGVGKTTLAATAAELGKVLFIDAESGAKFINEKYSDKIDLLVLNDAKLLDEVLKPENLKEYKTIIIDSATEVMKKLIDKVKGNKDKPTLADWGLIITQMESYFRKLRDLDKNIILVALSQEKGDEDLVLKRPALAGKNLPADIVGIVDICVYLENSQQGRIAYTQPTIKYYAKDRTGKLPDKIMGENLNIKFIVDKVLSKPEPLSEEQLKSIYNMIAEMKYDEKTIVEIAKFGNASVIEDLTKVNAIKVIKALEKKLELYKSNEKVK